MTYAYIGSSQGYPSLNVISGPQSIIEKTLTVADFVGFLMCHDAFLGISVETMKVLMASQGVIEGKNLFNGGAWVFYPEKCNI